MDSSPLAPSTGPQIRSRITVVCAECKRLKLKCDRRTPCGSCTKRDTVARCIYSPAAAEKVDLHSLNNRLLIVESALAQLTAGASSSAHNNPYSNGPHNDRALLAIGTSGSSLVISRQDVLSIWLEELDINQSILPTPTRLSAYSSPPSAHVKLEPSPISLSLDPHSLEPTYESFAASPTLTLPPLSIYHLPATSHLPFPTHSSASSSGQHPQITPQLLALLPPLSTLNALGPLMAMHPCFNWRHFRERVKRLLKGDVRPANADPPRERERPKSGEKTAKVDTARAIFFGPPHPTTRTPVIPPSSSKDRERDGDIESSSTSGSTISFFAAATAAFALSALVLSSKSGSGEEASGQNSAEMPMIIDFIDGTPGASAGTGRKKRVKTKQPIAPRLSTSSLLTSKGDVCRPSMHPSTSPHSADSSLGFDSGSPAFLFALSMQALSVHEMGAHFDLDYLVACILQTLFLLHDGGGGKETAGREISGEAENEGGEESLLGIKAKGKAKSKETLGNTIFPLVGKMVNIARQMGLGMDPDEFPGRYSTFEAETRRRIWWDIYYYDLFVSDCMGHPPLVQDGSFTTKLPADADEEVFSPASVSVPAPLPMARRGSGTNSGADVWCPNGFKYFELKCRLAQLVKGMKRRTFKDPSSDPRELAYTIDQAAGFESEVRQWLADLPQPFWLDMSFADGLGDGNRMSPLDMLASPSPPSMMTVPPILMAHQCELAITANRLILKLYLPFLRPGAYNSNAFPPHQASHGTVNAAHVIIHASKVLYSVWKQHQQQHTEASEPMLTLTPAMFGFYSFGRTLFDAAVVCAHAAIKQPTSVWAGVAFADVGAALEVMRDPIVEGTGSRGVTGMEGDVSEAVKVIEMMRKKADAARNGMKRKHDEVDGVIELAGFRFPYVGPAVTSVPGRGSPAQQRQQHHCQQPDTDTTPSNPRPKFETKATTASAVHDVGGEEAEKPQSGKLAKKVQYPPVGIRVRPGKEGSPLVRERHRSSSTATSTTTGSNEARMYAPAPLPPLTSAPRAPLTTQPRTPVSGDAGYHHPHHSANLQQDSNQDMYRRSSLAQDIPMQQDVMTQPSGANLSGTIDYPMRFGAGGDDVQMDVNVLTRRRFSIHDLGQNQQPQQHNFPTDNPPTFDQPRPGSLDHSSRGAFDSDSHCSLDRSCGDQYGSASSPYTGRPDTGTPSGPISSASSPYTSSGPAPSSLSTPTFGHHPSPTTYGHQPLHASPTSYAPSPLTNPNLHTFYVTNGYESQYNNGGISLVGLGMEDDNNNGSNMVSAVVDTPSYEKPQRILYDVKSPDAHHLGSGTLQPPFPVDQGRAPSQSHGMSTMLPSQQPWTPESGPGPQAGEYWGGGDFKFYQ